MSIFAIGDLHLPGRDNKEMDIFGAHWERHFEIIENAWRERIDEGDIVLIPGDISWAMHLKDAMEDLEAIARLPGRKILIRGNHDYWWSAVGKVRAALAEDMYVLQNDSLKMDGYVFCGTRGWNFPTESTPLEGKEEKIYLREVERLKISLESAKKQEGTLLAMMHFPPLFADGVETVFSAMLEEAGVTDVVYGHLHGVGIKNGYEGIRNGVKYHLVSCDAIGFIPKEIIGEKYN